MEVDIQQQIFNNLKIISAFSGRACVQTLPDEFKQVNQGLQAFAIASVGSKNVCPVSGKTTTVTLKCPYISGQIK